MRGLMMDTQLMISSLLRSADKNYPEREIVSVTADNPRHRYTFRECFQRTRQLANALHRLGAEPGDRIATLAWNDYRHLELYYAVSGSAMVCHTINPKLFPEQVAYIVNHAEDRFVFVDLLVVPLLEALADQLQGVQGFIVLTDEEHMPKTTLPNTMCYETLIAAETDAFEWPEFDENTASSLCYTSGTTGNPKGVLYSHRSTLLHTYASCLPDVLGVSGHDTIMPIVPMFHANGWGIPYSAILVGSKIVFPGPKMGDDETLQYLMEEESITIAAGVPTIWLGLLSYLKETGKRIDSIRRLSVGGAACPLSIIEGFRDEFGITVCQGWGMTETSPLGTIFSLKSSNKDLPADEVAQLQVKQGRGVFGIELKITDPDGNEQPWDGVAFGALKVRGPWVCKSYFRLDDASPLDKDGWFDTGDVATIDPDGYMQITDRTKDVIKSGGEWISSIDLENAAVDNPKVAEAAVIGRYHPKWSERPLLIAVRNAGADVDKDEILSWLGDRVAKMWRPDDVVFVDELPHTATGKINKLELREQFKDYKFPGT